MKHYVPGSSRMFILTEDDEAIDVNGEVNIRMQLNHPDEFDIRIKPVREAILSKSFEMEVNTVANDDAWREAFFGKLVDPGTGRQKLTTLIYTKKDPGYLDPLYEGWEQPRSWHEFWKQLKFDAYYTWRKSIGRALAAPRKTTWSLKSMVVVDPIMPPPIEMGGLSFWRTWPTVFRFMSSWGRTQS